METEYLICVSLQKEQTTGHLSLSFVQWDPVFTKTSV